MPVLDIGVSRSTGLTCYWSLSQVLTLGFYAREGGATRTTPEIMLRQIEDTRMREISRTVGLNRKIVLIVEGSREYLTEWMTTVAGLHVSRVLTPPVSGMCSSVRAPLP